MTRCSLLPYAIIPASIVALCGFVRPATAQVVRFDTVMGSFDVQLLPPFAPTTVQNFLNYVEDGDYDNTIIHRSVPTFIIQGGGYTTDFNHIPTDPPIPDEPLLSNVRGTIAMAKTAAPNSATSQWYFNLDDNSFLDPDFTAFGLVVGNGMQVVDAIAALPVYDLDPPYACCGEIPLRDFDGLPATDDELVIVTSITVIPEPSSLLLLLVVAVTFGLSVRNSRRGACRAAIVQV